MYLCGGSPDFFFNFHIWTTEVIPYNALNSEFANFETPCIFWITSSSRALLPFSKMLYLRPVLPQIYDLLKYVLR
jgi:hypothetical protein